MNKTARECVQTKDDILILPGNRLCLPVAEITKAFVFPRENDGRFRETFGKDPYRCAVPRGAAFVEVGKYHETLFVCGCGGCVRVGFAVG